MKKIIALSLVSVFYLISCSGESKKVSVNNEQIQEQNLDESEVVNIQEDLPFKDAIDNYVFAQDTSMESFFVMNSLPFANLDEEKEYQSFFYYDDQKVLKVVEEFFNTKNGQEIKRYYFDGEEMKYASKIVIDYNDNSKYSQKQYYFENGDLKNLYETKVFGEEASAIALTDEKIEPTKAFQILNLEGEFAITFAGFIEQPAGAFIVVNCGLPGYNSAILVDQQGADAFVEDLYSNREQYMGKKLKLKWELRVDPNNGLKQNVYRGGEWLN